MVDLYNGKKIFNVAGDYNVQAANNSMRWSTSRCEGLLERSYEDRRRTNSNKSNALNKIKNKNEFLKYRH